jgi:hypothetical protein
MKLLAELDLKFFLASYFYLPFNYFDSSNYFVLELIFIDLLLLLFGKKSN